MKHACQLPAQLDAFLALRGLKRVLSDTRLNGNQQWHLHRLLDNKRLSSALCFDSDLDNYISMLNLSPRRSLDIATWDTDGALRQHLRDWYALEGNVPHEHAKELLAALRAIIEPNNNRVIRWDSARQYYVARIEPGELERARLAVAQAIDAPKDE